MVVEVPLTKGYVALIDDEDADAVLAHRWCARIADGRAYAMRRDGRRDDGRVRYVYLHRFLMGEPEEVTIDHVNRNSLDNRRANLRVATERENGANKLKRGVRSRYKGVWPSRTGCKWVAVITSAPGKRRHLGTFETEEEAARAWDDAARVVYGYFATYNFPRDGEQGALC